MSKRKFDGPGPIPARWLRCPRLALSLIGDKFFAFKTPLNRKFDSSVPEEYRFYPQMVFDAARQKLKKTLGLWIDLTNTSRFYDRTEIESQNCRYIKISCKGHGETPSTEAVECFVRACKMFIQQNPLQIIGVHCTHGFNRTGFLIVSYLVLELDWSVEAAVNEFSKARVPGIYKQHYLTELFTIYGDADDTPEAPTVPDWELEEEEEEPEAAGDGDGAAGTSNGNGVPRKKRRETVLTKAVFMDGVPGVQPMQDLSLAAEVQRRVQTLCDWKGSGFPGSQPVSMDVDNLDLLRKPYQVSWKADGTRCLMYIKGPREIFLLDRDNAVFLVEDITFVNNQGRHIVDTLLDGEMVIDVDERGQQQPRFLAYDIVSYEGNKIRKENFLTRFRYIKKDIMEPREAAKRKGIIRREREPFGVRVKEFWDVHTAGYLMSDRFTRKLAHEPDGLIFQPVEEPYIAGQCPGVLKWKPPSMNSVDFRLKITVVDKPGMLRERVCQLFVNGLDQPFSCMKFTRELKDLDNKIIECSYDMERNTWVFMRERTDKSFPNAFKTAQSVCKSIQHPVTKEILLNFIQDFAPRAPASSGPAPMGPPPSKAHRSY